MQETEMASIPLHLIYEQLQQLPVKSLERFKCLNRLCHSFITYPEFIYAHLDCGKRAAHVDPHKQCLIISCIEQQNPKTVVRFFTIRGIDDGVADFEYSAPASFDSYHVLPSCNGLVCFYGTISGGVYVCNPSTKKLRNLPDIDDNAAGFRVLNCGFGFDKVTGKCKVIKILERNLGVVEDDELDMRMDVFTVTESDYWRRIRFPRHCRFRNHQAPVFVNGLFHWMKVEDVGSSTSSFSIVSFHPGNEEFGEPINPPESVSGKKWHAFSLVELGEELCLMDSDFEMDEWRRMDVWTFKGVVVDGDGTTKEQWVNEVKILHPLEPINGTRPVALIHGCKEIFLHGYVEGLGDLNLYDPANGGFRRLQVDGIPSQYFHASPHVESLLPLW